MNLWLYLPFFIREAFQSKKRGNLGIGPNGEGRQKIKKSPKFLVGKSSKLGGDFRKSKKSQVPDGIRDRQIITHFHLMRTQKHKILSY